MSKVNLFVIGAPKCGTTALCEYLTSHPDIQFSSPKEAKYFHTDFNKSHRYVHSEKQYHSCFGSWPCDSKVIAEGTVWYLYSRVAVKNIIQYNPDAKFVVMLRNPIDLAYSLHSQLLYGGDESEKDFDAAWKLQDARSNKQHIPRNCRDPKSLQYGEIAKLGKQVNNLLNLVDRKNIKFIIFDDFIKNPDVEYLNVLSFIGLHDDGRKDFPKINENKKIQSGLLTWLLYESKNIKNKLGLRKSFGIWKFLSHLISVKSERSPLKNDMRNEMKEYFKDDVMLLSSLIDRNLNYWLDE